MAVALILSPSKGHAAKSPKRGGHVQGQPEPLSNPNFLSPADQLQPLLALVLILILVLVLALALTLSRTARLGMTSWRSSGLLMRHPKRHSGLLMMHPKRLSGHPEMHRSVIAVSR